MVKDYEGNLTDSGWKLARVWGLGDLFENHGEHARQDRFTRDVDDFLKAGDPVKQMNAVTQAADAGHAGAAVATPPGDVRTAPGTIDTGMARSIQTFLKAGQTTGGGFKATNVNLPAESNSNGGNPPGTGEPAQGQGHEVRGSIDKYEVRGPVENPGNTSPQPNTGTDTQRELFEKLKGYDYESQEFQRQQESEQNRQRQERENWEKLKGIDPDTQHIIHGPNSPVSNENFTITSKFGYRENPAEFHHGIDIRNGLGSEVYASESGVVSRIGRGKKHGENYITVTNRDGSTSTYSHTTPRVKVGDKLYSKDVLGVTDMSGRTDGPHLHYEYTDKQGYRIDPATRFQRRKQ